MGFCLSSPILKLSAHCRSHPAVLLEKRHPLTAQVTLVQSYLLCVNDITNRKKKKKNNLLTISQVVCRLSTHLHVSCVYVHEHASVCVCQRARLHRKASVCDCMWECDCMCVGRCSALRKTFVQMACWYLDGIWHANAAHQKWLIKSINHRSLTCFNEKIWGWRKWINGWYKCVTGVYSREEQQSLVCKSSL